MSEWQTTATPTARQVFETVKGAKGFVVLRDFCNHCHVGRAFIRVVATDDGLAWCDCIGQLWTQAEVDRVKARAKDWEDIFDGDPS